MEEVVDSQAEQVEGQVYEKETTRPRFKPDTAHSRLTSLPTSLYRLSEENRTSSEGDGVMKRQIIDELSLSKILNEK